MEYWDSPADPASLIPQDEPEKGLTEECGVFGAIGMDSWPTESFELAQIICTGLLQLQHRGQESCGIAIGDCVSIDFHIKKGMGLLRSVIEGRDIREMPGNIGIGHTRYATAAASSIINCQPFVVHSMHGTIAVAHNGEVVNKESLRKMVLDRGVGLSTHSDSELITQALCLNPPTGETEGPDWPARIRHLMQLAPLSYSFVVMMKDKIYAVRDPYGNRPLCLGRIASQSEGGHQQNGVPEAECWVVCSESCAFPAISAKYVREVMPGEILEMTQKGVRTVDVVARPAGKSPAFCIFEYVYFARPNTLFEGQSVYRARVECGMQLALEHSVEADVVGAVPESGNAAAIGYSNQSGIPCLPLLAKNHYVGRTFIQPTKRLRQSNVANKFSPIDENVQNKRVILIDDSIVRGNTIGPIIRLLREAGAKEVHIRVASPPLKYPCYMGINIPTREELIANDCFDSVEIASKVGADSLMYLSVEGLVKAVNKNIPKDVNRGHCTACLTGVYPAGLPDRLTW